MSVIIKKMQIPKNCQDCDLLYDGFACMASHDVELDWDDMGKKRHDDCPLIEAPSLQDWQWDLLKKVLEGGG